LRDKEQNKKTMYLQKKENQAINSGEVAREVKKIQKENGHKTCLQQTRNGRLAKQKARGQKKD